MKNIYFLAIDSSSILHISGEIWIFKFANIVSNYLNPGNGPMFNCTVVAQDKFSCEISDGFEFNLNKSIVPYKQADIIISNGFLYNSIEHLTERLNNVRASLNWLKRQYENGAYVAAACSGSVLLAEAGLLNGKEATTSWWLEDYFRTRYPEIKLLTEHIIVPHERLITAGAVTSYYNMLLSIIGKFGSRNLAQACSKFMLIDINRQSQSPYSLMNPMPQFSDNLVSKAQSFICENFQKNIDMNELSDYLAVSYRTLARRFKATTGDPPTRYVQKVRIEAAKGLLETTDLNFETITERVGYSDVSTFTQLFKRITSITPVEYRRKFSMI